MGLWAIAGCGNCKPMQSAGSMYFSRGSGGFALQYLLQFYMQTLNDAIRCVFAGLQICRPHFELCIAGLVSCMVQPLRAAATADCSYCGPSEFQYKRDLHNLMHFYIQTLSDALFSELAGLRLYTVDHMDLRA